MSSLDYINSKVIVMNSRRQTLLIRSIAILDIIGSSYTTLTISTLLSTIKQTDILCLTLI